MVVSRSSSAKKNDCKVILIGRLGLEAAFC
jgi:hypothetical protein